MRLAQENVTQIALSNPRCIRYVQNVLWDNDWAAFDLKKLRWLALSADMADRKFKHPKVSGVAPDFQIDG